MALPEDTSERAKEWAEGEEAKVRKREELAGRLSEVMQARGRDPIPIREAITGR